VIHSDIQFVQHPSLSVITVPVLLNQYTIEEKPTECLLCVQKTLYYNNKEFNGCRQHRTCSKICSSNKAAKQKDTEQIILTSNEM